MDKFKWGTWKEIDVFEILHDLWLLRWLWRESSSTPSLRGRACSDLEIWSLRQTGSGWDHFHHCTICTFFSWTSAKVLSVWLALLLLLLEGGGFFMITMCTVVTIEDLQVRNPEQLQLVIEEGTEFITLKIQPTLSLTQVEYLPMELFQLLWEQKVILGEYFE